MSRQQRPAKPTRDATGRVGVVAALRAAAASEGVSVVQTTQSMLTMPSLTRPGRVRLRDPSSQHRRAPISTVKTP